MIANEVCDEQGNCQRLYWIGVVSRPTQPSGSATSAPQRLCELPHTRPKWGTRESIPEAWIRAEQVLATGGSVEAERWVLVGDE